MHNQQNIYTKVPVLSDSNVIIEDISDEVSRVTVAPLAKGFGNTLGNALRRVILAYIPGCAITAVKIEGALHEYSTLPGVKEDVASIVLNLRKVIAAPIEDGDTKVVEVFASGPRVLTATDFASQGIEIGNPNQEILHILDGASINMQVTFSNGRGFRSVKDAMSFGYDSNVGTILVDAVFNPVKLVSFRVEDARVGQKIGYDKLVMEITSNKEFQVKNALDLAAKILIKQFNPFIFFDDRGQETCDGGKEEVKFDPVLLKKVDDLESLSVRSSNCLRNMGVVFLGDLVTKSESEILKTPNFGRKSLKEIKNSLRNLGLSLNMTVDNWSERDESKKN